MTAQFKRARSRPVARFGMPLAVLIAIAVGLLAPTLGSARLRSAPVATAEPKISGTAAEGQTLTTTLGTWTGNPVRFDINWRRCVQGSAGAGNCDGITNHADNTYTLTAQDVGFTIRTLVKAWNSADEKGTSTSNATDVVTGVGGGPANTSLPTITGAAQVGQTLTAGKGSWDGSLIDYAYDWLRCDATGSNCLTLGATGTTYVVAAADRGSTARVRVTATNPSGSAQATSAQTAVVPGGAQPPPPPPPPPPPSGAGCPTGRVAQVSSVTEPASLLIDRQAAQPLHLGSGQQIVVRYHVSDTCGQSVEGALVYATAVPFGQLSNPAEAATGPTGYVSLTFETLASFPLGKKQRNVQIFVRARKQGEDLLAGISARRLFAIPITP